MVPASLLVLAYCRAERRLTLPLVVSGETDGLAAGRSIVVVTTAIAVGLMLVAGLTVKEGDIAWPNSPFASPTEMVMVWLPSVVYVWLSVPRLPWLVVVKVVMSGLPAVPSPQLT